MENKIIRVFLYNHKLKFNEIEKALKTRSNKLSYHIKNLIKKKILEKQGEYYRLTKTAETLIPYLSEKKSPLPVILIAIKKNKNRVFLYKRKKRPFREKLSLPGGRIILGESLEKATQRIMKEKFKINCELQKINSISIEHVKNKDKILHTFLLILVTGKTEDKIEYTDISKNKSKIISSDYKLIKKNLDKEIKIEELETKL